MDTSFPVSIPLALAEQGSHLHAKQNASKVMKTTYWVCSGRRIHVALHPDNSPGKKNIRCILKPPSLGYQTTEAFQGEIRRVISQPDPAIPCQLGFYGKVYQKEALIGDKEGTVAVKVNNPELIHSDQPYNHILIRKEAEVLSMLDHPNIVRFLDDFQIDQNTHALVTEWVPFNLHYALQEVRDVLPGTRELMISQLSKAVQYLSAKQVFHCDLKPANIQLTATNNIKVIDFGSCTLRGMNQAPSPGFHCTYMAPELSEAFPSPFSEKTEIWSLGYNFLSILAWQYHHESWLPHDDFCKKYPGEPSDLSTGFFYPVSCRQWAKPEAQAQVCLFHPSWFTWSLKVLELVIWPSLDVNPGNRPASLEAVHLALSSIHTPKA